MSLQLLKAQILALPLGLFLAAPLWAHPLAPALLEIAERGDGSAEVTWKVPATAALEARLRPLLPPGCAAATTPPRAIGNDPLGAAMTWSVECRAGLVGSRLAVAGLEAANTQALLRLVLADGHVVQKVLTGRAPSFTVPPRPSPLQVAVDYLWLGIEHIATGADHLLFVLGLVLLIPAVRALALAITGFTLGHSVTLSLAVLGYASLPSRPVEICIALSVFALAVELTRERPSTLLRRWPWVAAAGFGLLHGLGFAGALRDVGLPADEVPLALLSFNGGIELGQLTFVVAALGAGRFLARLQLPLPRWARLAPVYGMGTLAAFWVIERGVGVLP